MEKYAKDIKEIYLESPKNKWFLRNKIDSLRHNGPLRW
jgi:hypothetical protein